MLYEIVNMSDAYTIECPDNEIAIVACILLGEGQYAFTAIERGTAPDVPLMFSGLKDADSWCEQHLHDKFEPVLARVLATRGDDLATAFDSVLIGNANDREVFAALTKGMTPKRKLKARATWHDKKRSSLNDIGGRAYAIAAQLRVGESAADRPRAPQQVFSK